MCGIIGLLLANHEEHVRQLLFDGLTVLQHRGQDAAGIVTSESSKRLHLRKDNGLVRDVFSTHHMIQLQGHVGLGHCRYPTAGSSSCAEAQPLYTNYPYGICVAHNGNLTNTDILTKYMREEVGRHVNTDSDSELLLNIFAEAMTKQMKQNKTLKKDTVVGNDGRSHDGNNNDKNNYSSNNMVEDIFSAMETVMAKCQGGYAGMYLINGVGLVGFRDPHGIRPMVFGSRKASHTTTTATAAAVSTTPSGQTENGGMDRTLDYAFASESVAIDTLGFHLERDIQAGEAIFVDMNTGAFHSRIVHPNPQLYPCIFEYVYFARPDSIMDGISVYETRLKMGEKLADAIVSQYGPNHDIDVVIPIPDTSRTSALQAAYRLHRPFREGFIKNRYIARTFIMPGQATRKKSVRLKLNTIKSEFVGRNVLLVDDSIVRGTTAGEIVQMAREAGAKKVYFCSAAPAIRYPNIYGIDIPTQEELIAYQRSNEQIANKIGCDWIVYQDLEDLKDAVRECVGIPQEEGQQQQQQVPSVKDFDTSCFSGEYVTGQQIGDEYFQKLHLLRNDKAKQQKNADMVNGVSTTTTTTTQSSSSLLLTSKTISSSSHHSSLHKSAVAAAGSCEPVSNDQRQSTEPVEEGCESLTNQQPMAGVVR